MSNTTLSSRPSDVFAAEHAPSYYAATAADRRERPRLEGDITADVCIIGAGFTGLSAALTLAERGMSVVVLEAERVGFGASGRNGGQLVNGYSRDIADIEKRYGAAAARELGSMSLEGSRIIGERVARYAIQCDLKPGNAFLAFRDKQLIHLEHAKRDWERFGHDGLEMVDATGVARYVASDRYVGGLIDHRGGHFHPLNFVLGEATALEGLGGRIFEHSRVTAVDIDVPLARTGLGSIRAKFLLVCGNAYLGHLLPAISGKIMPVSSQQIATAPLGPYRASAVLPADYAMEDTNYILDYYRRTADHRLLYGGGVGYGGQDPGDIIATIHPRMLKTFPALHDVDIEFAWSGNFALTLTRIPHVGRLNPHVYFSHGDSGHGVTTTQLLGAVLGEAVAGQSKRFDVWASLPYFAFPGGHALRVPLTALGALWYDMRDRLGI